MYFCARHTVPHGFVVFKFLYHVSLSLPLYHVCQLNQRHLHKFNSPTKLLCMGKTTTHMSAPCLRTIVRKYWGSIFNYTNYINIENGIACWYRSVQREATCGGDGLIGWYLLLLVWL